jgi:DNA repair exonuclease SbcCD nuclease subunit
MVTGGEIITADWHAHCWRDGGQPVAGVNRRLEDFLFAFRELLYYAGTHKVKRIVCLGDVFHLKKNVPEQARNRVYAELKASTRDIDWLFIPGNHDREDDRWDSVTIQSFDRLGTVYPDIATDMVNRRIYVPWLYDHDRVLKFFETLKGEWETLYFHGEIDGAFVGPADYQLKSKVSAKQLQLKRFDRAFAGHLHRRQDVSGVWYPGSLIAINHGEPETDKGFLHIQPNGKVVPVTVSYPKFMTLPAPEKPTVTWAKDVAAVLKGNIMKILTPKSLDPAFIKILEDGNPRALSIRLERASILPGESQNKGGTRSLGSLVEAYVKARGIPEPEQTRYVTYGLEKLEAA